MELIELNNQPIKSFMREIKKHPYHWGDCITIIKVIKGSIKFRTWGKNYYLNKDDYFILNIGQVHDIESISDTNLLSITKIEQFYCKKIVLNIQEVIIFCNSLDCKYLVPDKHIKIEQYIEELIENIIIYNNNLNHKKIELIVSKLLIYVCCNCNYLNSGINLKKFNIPIIERYNIFYKTFFRMESPLSKYTLKEVAPLLGVSYIHLRKDIIERFGFGYKALKYNVMVENALKMILETNDTLMQITYSTGFSDQKYLIKYFKLYFESTPSKFRKKYRNNFYERNRYKEYPLNSFQKYNNKIKF